MGNGKLAVVTGASSGIGRELAKLCAKDGYDLVIVADEPAIEQAAEALRSHGVSVDAVEADLARENGADKLIAEIGDRDIDLLFLNAGRGLGRGFVDQDWNEARRVIDTNITGTVYLAHRLGRKMVGRGRGRILFTGSIAGFTPGTFQAVYNGTKAFIDSFAIALRHELKDSGVSVDAGRHADALLRARRHDGYRNRGAREGQSRRCGQGRLRRLDGRRGASDQRLEEQDAGRRRPCHTGRHTGRTAPQHGRTGFGEEWLKTRALIREHSRPAPVRPVAR